MAALVQGFVEYATTTCSAQQPAAGRTTTAPTTRARSTSRAIATTAASIGYTADRDAENYALGATYLGADGALWTATARTSRLNRDDGDDSRNTVASGARRTTRRWSSAGRAGCSASSVSVDLGVESLEPEGGERDVEPFGFVGWRHEFRP